VGVSTAIVVGLFVAPVRGDDTAGGPMRNVTDVKLGALPAMPDCAAGAAMNGDPMKGAATLLLKLKANCTIPWHWHTATEQVMMVSGSGKMEMKDMGKPTVLTAGGFAFLPAKHVHTLTCQAECMLFVSSDGAFDIHYIDANGKEIEPAKALGKPAKAAQR
jgi:quercetin dioxygenase-like cupin family protein